MLSAEVIGFLGSDAKRTEKGCSFNVSHKYKEKGYEKTIWISCFLNYETKIVDYLKTGVPIYVSGDITVSTYSRENGDVIPTITMSVKKIELLPNSRSKE